MKEVRELLTDALEPGVGVRIKDPDERIAKRRKRKEENLREKYFERPQQSSS